MTPIVKIRLRRVSYRKNQFEKEAWAAKKMACGIDEVGRGCLAGPLVAAAVILPPDCSYKRLKDSKILTEHERELAYAWLIKHAWYGIGIVHNRIIDRHNIWQATLLAMKRALLHAIAQSPHTIDLILIDAMPLKLDDMGLKDTPVHYFPKGESISSSVAAASIIAKVTRDRIMHRMDRIVTGYYLAEHKGYATAKHRTALSAHGASSIHRLTFLDTECYESGEAKPHEQQQSLW